MLALVTATAHADPDIAKRLAAEAEAFAAKSDFVSAAVKFREAFAVEPRQEYMCNVGVAYHKAKDLPRAHRYLRQCVNIGASLDAAYLDNVRRVIEAAETKLFAGDFTPIDFLIEPSTATIAVEGGLVYDEPIVGSGRIWFPYGSYKLTIHAEGFIDKPVPIEARSDAAIPIREKLERVPAPPPPIRRIAGVPPSKTPAVVATIATAASGLGGVVLYYVASHKVAQAEETPDRSAFDRLAASAKRYQHASWAFGGLAGAGAIVSAYLWYRATRTPATIEVKATGDGAAVSIGGRF